jgi:glycosyltransferase involved in cell wall biosynthesis
MMARLQNQIHALGLDQTVVLTGFRPDAAELIQAMDLFCLPSFSEGASMALLEAMALGIPAIVTRVGGNPELVKDQQTGWVIPSDNLSRFVQTLTLALENSGQRHVMGCRAKERFNSFFTFDAMIAAYERLYEKIFTLARR